MKPFWKSKTMVGESVLFIKQQDNTPAVGKLLFTPTKIFLVKSSSGAITYRTDTDYTFKPGSRTITIPTGSTIPTKTMAELTPPKGSQPYGLIRRDGKGDILFGATHEYADMQVEITYEHSGTEWKIPAPVFSKLKLPLLLAKLQQCTPVTIVMFGDSISTGCNASKWANVAPFMPFYGDLVVENLEKTYKSKITMKNFSVGGQTSGWGVSNIGQVSTEKPDLVILAWGMNDSTGDSPCPTATFVANLQAQMDAVRKVQPQAEFIIVSSSLPNVNWHIAHPEAILEYRNAVKKLVSPGIAMADVTSVYEEILKRKDYLDLTGNGVNHPNDFCHRIYAQILSSLLIETAP